MFAVCLLGVFRRDEAGPLGLVFLALMLESLWVLAKSVVLTGAATSPSARQPAIA